MSDSQADPGHALAEMPCGHVLQPGAVETVLGEDRAGGLQEALLGVNRHATRLRD